MKKLVGLIIALLPLTAFAQGAVSDLKTDLGARVGVSVDKRIMEGLHVVSYKGLTSVTPYGFLEVRNVFNDPAFSAAWSTASLTYTDAYVNRIRGSLGLEFKLSRQHALDLHVLGDYCYEKNIVAAPGGTTLQSLSYDRAFKTAFHIGYQFSF